jgi:BirA family biotin operon repressor/biotin-[acetyl-CoA-carboxylase] ligase
MDKYDRILIESLADGRFHSGTEIAQVMGISRAGVWKHVRRLENFGLEVVSVPGKGYRLTRPIELLDAEKILQGVDPAVTRLLGPLHIESVLESTNSTLMQMALGTAPDGTVVLAEFQKQGRGRIGRSWLSPLGGGICLSLLWRFQDPRQVAGLSLAVGVGLSRALESIGARDVALKWPNDLLWQGAKLGGILIEIAGEAHGSCAVVIGVGLNIDLPTEIEARIDQSATDLRRVLGGKTGIRNDMVAGFISHLLRILAGYAEEGLQTYLPEWRAIHGDSGKPATIRVGDEEVVGKVLDVSPEGFLIFEEEGGKQRTFASGEVRLRVIH